MKRFQTFWIFAVLALAGLMVSAQPVITTQPTNQIVLSGGNATFSVMATGTGWLSYQWRFNGTNLWKYTVTTVAGSNGVSGYSGDGGPATAAELSYPTGVTMDNAGNIFIADDGNNRIRRVDTNGIISSVALVNDPLQVAVDGADDLYVADNADSWVFKVDTNGLITIVAGNGTNGYSGDGGQATNAILCWPNGVTLDQAGNLYIADYGNNRIRKVGTNGIITTVAGNGADDYSGDGSQATNAGVNAPVATSFDSIGDLYIADWGNDRIRKVDLSGIITTVAGNGWPYDGGDGGAATNASLEEPSDVVLDVFGRLLIADVGDGLVRQVDTNGIITTLVTGLSFPTGLFVDPNDDLYIAESQSAQIGKVALLGPPTLNLNQVTLTNAGNYDVIISDSFGSVSSSVASLTVDVPAYISTQPQSQQVSVGSNVTFSVICGGTLPLNYQWLLGGAAISGATSSNYTFNIINTNQTGSYSVLVSNDYGSVTSSIAALTVVVIPPGIATQPAGQTAQGGSNVVFGVVASGSPPFYYQWFFNGAAMDGQTNSNLSLPNVTTNQAGAYSVWVSSPYGSVTSSVATLTVGGLPSITMQPTNQTLLAGSRVLVAAAVTGLGPLTFQWQLNGTNLPNDLITTVAGNGTNGSAGDGGVATNGEFNFPVGVAADNAGNLFIVDYARIRKVETNGIITTVAGTGNFGYSGDNGPATNAAIATVRYLNGIYETAGGVAVDGAGNLFIADYNNSRIRKVDTNGIITTVAGTRWSGYFGDGGSATNARLYYPWAVALDANGDLLIADSGNNRIRMVDTNGTIMTVAGKGTLGYSGDGGLATNASLDSPQGLAVDAAGDLFIADHYDCRVRKVDTYGVITTIAGNGSVLYSGDGGAATNAGMGPYSVSLDNYGDLMIADYGNNRIRRVDPYGIITTVAGTNGWGYNGDIIPSTNACLFDPAGVTLDCYGRTLVADTANNRIRRFGQGPILVLDSVSAANAGAYTLVVNSSYGSVTSQVATLTVLLPPTIVIPPSSQSAGLGSNATFTVTASGTAPLAYQWQFNGTNLPAQAAPSLSLTNVQWNNGGNYAVIITNSYGNATSAVVTLTVGWPPVIASQPASQMILTGTNLLLSIAATGGGPFSYQWQLNGSNLPPVIITVAGNGTYGFSGDGGPATNAELSSPYGVALDANGNIYISDSDNRRIRRVDANGIITTVAGTGTPGFSGNGNPATNATLGYPEGMAFDCRDNLYIADFNDSVIWRVDTNGIITIIAGTGNTGYSLDGGLAINTFLGRPPAVAIDTNGDVFLADFYGYRIREVLTDGIITTVAGITTFGVRGGYSGDGGPATDAVLGAPTGVALDNLGNMFISDTDNYRIRKVDPNGIITTVAGGGSYYSNNIPGTNANFKPNYVAVDPWNNVFISCWGSYVSRLDTNGMIATVAGGGASYPGDYGPATNASLGAEGLAFDTQGNLFIADSCYARIRKVCFSGLPTFLLAGAGTNNTGNYDVVVSSPFGSVTSSNFTVTVVATPLFGSSLLNADGSVTLNLFSTPNFSTRLYAATNLAPPVVWTPISTNSAGGAWQFTDTNAVGQPVRFYQMSTP